MHLENHASLIDILWLGAPPSMVALITACITVVIQEAMPDISYEILVFMGHDILN